MVVSGSGADPRGVRILADYLTVYGFFEKVEGHYRPTAVTRAFLDAARAGGVEISALSIPQCCISAAVAAVVREAGATQVMVAATPDENALFEALERALRA